MTRRFALSLALPYRAGDRVRALAHPGHDHKILGTVTMAAADHVMVKDKAGKDVTVHITADTKVAEGKKADEGGGHQGRHARRRHRGDREGGQRRASWSPRRSSWARPRPRSRRARDDGGRHSLGLGHRRARVRGCRARPVGARRLGRRPRVHGAGRPDGVPLPGRQAHGHRLRPSAVPLRRDLLPLPPARRRRST